MAQGRCHFAVVFFDMTPEPARFSLRPAVERDSSALAELRAALFLELGEAEGARPLPAFEVASTDAFAKRIADGSCFAWLAEAPDGRAVGSVALLIYPRLPSPELLASREGYLLNVYTLPDWRGRGVATGLVRAAVSKGRDLGLARIRLHTTTDGRPVYAAAGFEPREDEMELRLEGDS